VSTEDKNGFFIKFKATLSHTRTRLGDGIAELVLRQKGISDEFLEDVETQMLTADIGIEATTEIIENLRKKMKRKDLVDPSKFMLHLKSEMIGILKPCEQQLEVTENTKPFVILVVGANGVGKTTTIGKLANLYREEGRKVMLAAGDTFRAAAIEQLQVWGDKNGIPVVSQKIGADSASVIYDAYQSAKAKEIDVLIADTAGRIHTKDNLMNELEKIGRVLKNQDQRLPDEVILIIDSTTGQNALSQVASFRGSIPVSGIILTKLDGSTKGGIALGLARKFRIPFRFVGVGEQIEDLLAFSSTDFVEALFPYNND
jgi:fused signal recognition particle receptor